MLKNKRILIGLLIILMILILPSIVKAEETQSAQIELNGVTANFTYTLNEAGAIENLKCTNASDLKGAISIPSKIHDKNVVAIGAYAFDGGKEITEVTIPNGVQYLGIGAFSNCTGLTSITIPKSLTKSCGNHPFEGCSNITSVKFEDGIAEIPSFICEDLTGIKEITIPNSATKIGGYSFDGCSKLEKINFGTGVQYLGINAFSNCTGLTSITIPKSLTKSCGNHPFEGCSNITSVKFEDGIAEIPSFICEGLTGIKEITIPNSATKIGSYSFGDCSSLKKITILDNVKDFGVFTFEHHSDDLTIYCYEGTAAASYAVENHIKYVFLKKPVNSGTSDKQDEVSNVGKDSNTGTKDDTTKKDTTIATAKLPNTGKVIIAWIIGIVAVSGITAHIRYKKLYF